MVKTAVLSTTSESATVFATHRLVLPGDLNQFGRLFGGRLLAWVDEAAWIAVSRSYPHCQFVTLAMDHVEFRHGVAGGTILAICCRIVATGTTSVRCAVEVKDARSDEANAPLFTTCMTFVAIDQAGNKCPIDPRSSSHGAPQA